MTPGTLIVEQLNFGAVDILPLLGTSSSVRTDLDSAALESSRTLSKDGSTNVDSFAAEESGDSYLLSDAIREGRQGRLRGLLPWNLFSLSWGGQVKLLLFWTFVLSAIVAASVIMWTCEHGQGQEPIR